MTHARLLAVVLSLAAALVGAAQTNVAEEDYVKPRQLRALGLVKAWQIRLPLADDQRLLDIYRVDDVIYACTADGFAFAVQADTGAIRWVQRVSRSGFRLHKPAHAGDRVIFATSQRAAQYDRYNGTPLIDATFRFPASSGVVSDGQRYYIGGLDGRFYCYRLNDTFPIWKVGTRGAVTATPAIRSGALYVADDAGGVYACIAATRVGLWSTDVGGPVTADVVTHQAGTLIASRGGTLSLIAPGGDFTPGGSFSWRLRMGGPLYEGPDIYEDVAFQHCPADGLYAVEIPLLGAEQRVRWLLAEGRRMLTVHKDSAFVLSNDRRLLKVDRATGKVTARGRVGDMAYPLSWPTRSTVLLANRDGRLFAARPQDLPLPTRTDVQRALQPPETRESPETETTGETEQPAETAAAEEELGPRPVGATSRVSKEYIRRQYGD